MRAVTDYCGIVSGESADKSGLFEVYYGVLKTAPLIAPCPLALECRLVREVRLETNTLFIGEIVESYTEERYRHRGETGHRKMNPLLLTMPDNR
ncbi:MAG: hypothetical protein HC894_26655 [Microcoleus sp. SM1_3_4]|nr:hypothetical protein [Microcoleus sp. SM1_3_4]